MKEPGHLQDNYCMKRMFNTFPLQGMQELHDSFMRSTELSNLMREKKAVQYMRFGVGRRLLMMWYAYRTLVQTVSLDRTEPLTSDESHELVESLNVIYLNIRGLLDNLAWALLYEYAPELAIKLEAEPHRVGLFQNCIVHDGRFGSLAREIQVHKEWNADMKDRRDPSAHRIPLYIPPQVLTPEEAAKYQKLVEKFSEEMAKLDLDAGNEALDEMERVGRFVPYFLHDPDDGLIPIYPTVPDDVGHVLQLLDAVDAFLVVRP
jgi:hypothetical protein